ncbi:MAG: dihydrolipoamide acetyltransferase family protein [Chloroflexota bacterium]
MAEVVTLPKLGLDMTEGTFINWTKKVGEAVKTGDVLAEIESDKATIEIESTASGVLTKTLVDVGQVVAVGAPIAEISTEGGASVPAAETAPAEVKSAPSASATTASTNGKPAPAVAAPAAVSTSVGEEFPGGIKASPVARKIAEEKGLDLHQIQGTGPGGRISKADVEGFTPSAVPAVAPAAVSSAPATSAIVSRPQQVAPTGPGISEEPVSKLRARIASRMVESKQTIPHFYVTTEIDMAPALALRKQINEGIPEDQKITVNDLVIKATALTLRQFPNLNSHFYGDKIVHFDHINIGIAVALDSGGLMNVVAKDADITSISRMAQRNKIMINNARAGKVKIEDIEGSTFTVSNLGAYDVEHFIAIINPPEAGILAVGSAREVPVVIKGEIKVGTRMKCTLSVDHRVSDGAEGARFMQSFKNLLETPMRLLI